MNQRTSYRIPAGYGEAEFTEKRSRFIGRIWHTANEDLAKECIRAVQRQHRDATHNVYAYIINESLMRYSDDGEPQGTSGIPTLAVLQQENVIEACCVITRYFGGTLLGAGGLVRAYSKAAGLALKQAGIMTMQQWDTATFTCPYSLFDQVKVLIADYGGIIESAEYTQHVLMTVSIPADCSPAYSKSLSEISSGHIKLSGIKRTFMEKNRS